MRKGIPYSRFSGKRQEAGDSQRRQDELAEQAAREEGVELDRTITLSDRGMSAFRGLNWKRGNLGKFLDLVDAGVIPKGTVLIVEQVNRLSRMPWMQQVELWKQILSRGIVIRTCVPPARYTLLNVNELAVGCPVVIYMMMAHLDSATKSEWVRQAWGEKKRRAAAENKPHGRSCPEWIRPVCEAHPKNAQRVVTVRYEMIDERKADIEQAFRWALDGWGASRIVRAFEESGRPAWNRAAVAHARKTGGPPRWRVGWVKYLLQNRQVMGEYQPTKGTEDGIVLEGLRVEGYYPAAVSEQTFLAVQGSRRKRSKTTGGRRGAGGIDANLFTGMVWESSARRPMSINTASFKGTRYRYLATDPATSNVPYEAFEAGVLDALSRLTARDVDGRHEADQLSELVGRLQEERTRLGLELDALDRQIRELPADRWPRRVVARMAELEAQVAAKDEELRHAKEAANTSGRAEALTEVKTCVQLLDEVAGTPREARVRERIKTRLPLLVESLWVLVQRLNLHKRIIHVRAYLHGGEPRYFQVLCGGVKQGLPAAWQLSGADFRAGDVGGGAGDAMPAPHVVTDGLAG